LDNRNPVKLSKHAALPAERLIRSGFYGLKSRFDPYLRAQVAARKNTIVASFRLTAAHAARVNASLRAPLMPALAA
jgi:hypothetical protein